MLTRLAERKRFLPPHQRVRYAEKVVLGEFFMRWARQHQGTTIDELNKHPKVKAAELQPFYLALMAIGVESTFNRIIPRLARQKTVAKYRGKVGDGEEFSCFVIDYSAALAHRFLSNFNPGVFNAAAKAVRYIEMTAVSFYLHVGMRESRRIEGMGDYLDRSKRMSYRTKLAAKLAYLPAALTNDERIILRDRFGVRAPIVRRMKVKDVASLLGYPNAAVVSRKLYRTRQWIRNMYQEMSDDADT